MDKRTTDIITENVKAYNRFYDQGKELRASMKSLDDRRKAAKGDERATLTAMLKKKMEVYEDLKDMVKDYTKTILKSYRRFKDVMPDQMRNYIRKTFDLDDTKLPEEQATSDEEVKWPDKHHPWLPIKLPRNRRKVMAKEDVGKVIVDFYSTVHPDDREAFDKLADFFFYQYFDQGLFKLKKHMQGTNLYRRIHTDARAAYESKMAWVSAIFFFRELVDSEFEAKLTHQKTAEIREKARRKLQSAEWDQIGKFMDFADLEDDFYRQFYSAQDFKESVQHSQHVKQQKTTSQPRKSTSLHKSMKKAPSAKSIAPQECHKLLTDLLHQLKLGSIASTDCAELTRRFNELRLHNSGARAQKLLHLKLTEELRRVIDDMVAAKKS